MEKQSVVFVGAHPDDMAAVAGTLVLLRRKGYAIHDVCLTRGEKGRDPGNGLDAATARRREEEAACALLGAELVMFDEPDGGRLFAHAGICEKVASLLKDLQPAAVITHWAFEKPDHAAAFGVAHRALHLAGLYWTTEFYMGDIFGGSDGFRPDLYVNISAVIAEKTAVADCYRNQWKVTSAEWVIPQAQAEGRRAWCDYAEGFATAMPLVGTRWNRPAEIGRVLLGL